jgi:arylsulfatase A-like enzyme
MRSYPAALFLAGLCAFACGSRGAGPGEGPPPSVLLISLDTLRADHLGLYGYARDTSPYLDRLARECLVFDRAYTPQPWTLVAHMSMLSGLEPEDHGVHSANVALSPEVPLVAERLDERGYFSVGLRSADCIWLDERYGFARGFDVYREHTGPADAERALQEALAPLARGRPVFAFVHLFDVHTKLFDKGFRGFYDPPEPFDRAFLDDARERLAHVDCRRLWEGHGTLTAEQQEAMVALYDGAIRFVDAELERIVEGWRESGLLQRSLLVITADHGEALGDHGLLNGHGGMFEEGLRVPLLVRFPDGFRAGEREQGLVSLIDVAPTILGEAGLAVEPWRPGRSLRQAPDPERVVRATRALVSERWKLWAGDDRRIFDLESDAGELAPLSESEGEAGERARELRRQHQEQRRARPAVPGAPIEIGELSEAEAAELRGLGYAGVLDR